MFTGAFQSGNYGPPGGLCWDYFCGDSPIQDDPRLEDYNVDERVNDFVKAALQQAGGTRGDINTMNIMWTMGSDFMYENAEEWFINLDKIIKAVNADGRVKAMYSTPSQYVKAKNAEPVNWTVKTDDFFPYADGANSYWSLLPSRAPCLCLALFPLSLTCSIGEVVVRFDEFELFRTGYFTSRPALKRYIRISSAFMQVARHIAVFTGNDATSIERLWEAQVTQSLSHSLLIQWSGNKMRISSVFDWHLMMCLFAFAGCCSTSRLGIRHQ